jgi:hypothetical protein
MRVVLEQTRAEGKPTMLDPPAVPFRVLWLASLYFPLRNRGKWGEPLSFDEIDGYLRMRGLDPRELFDWFAVADAAALEWMGEQASTQRTQMAARMSRGGHPTRH